MRRKEESLLHWHDILSDKERKLESNEDSLCNLMREIRIKDSLLAEKDLIIVNKEKEVDDFRRECRESVKQEVEVCWFIVLLVCLWYNCYRILLNCTGVKNAHTMTVGRFVNCKFLLTNLLLLGRLSPGAEVQVCWRVY